MFLQDKVKTFTIVTRQKKIDHFGSGADMSVLLGNKISVVAGPKTSEEQSKLQKQFSDSLKENKVEKVDLEDLENEIGVKSRKRYDLI